jgi:uncharacterized protein (TIGR00251 family)
MQEAALVSVRVTTRASRDEIVGWREGVLLVRLHAAPVDGGANQALCRLLADRLAVQLRQVEIVRGSTSRNKLLRIDGLGEAELRARLGLGD